MSIRRFAFIWWGWRDLHFGRGAWPHRLFPMFRFWWLGPFEIRWWTKLPVKDRRTTTPSTPDR